MPCNICKKCIGFDKCQKYCTLRAGYNFKTFLESIDLIETQIGEIRPSIKNSGNLVVSGHIIDSSDSPVYILTPEGTPIDTSDKFVKANGISSNELIEQYYSTIAMAKGSEADKERILSMLSLINSGKCLPVPLRPKYECDLFVSESKRKLSIHTKISNVRWKADSEGKLQCTVMCYTDKEYWDNDTTKVKYIPITEYGTTIVLSKIEKNLKISDKDRKLIQMTDLGFIKPIVVEDSEVKLALDGRYLYRVDGEEATILCGWPSDEESNFKVSFDIANSAAYKRINDSKRYVRRHLRYIVPYGCFEENYIKV